MLADQLNKLEIIETGYSRGNLKIRDALQSDLICS